MWEKLFNFLCFFKSMILSWKLHYVSDFELKKLQRVRFWIKKLKTCQISNWKFFIFSNLKFQPSPTACTSHIVFLHITMYSYSLQYLRQIDNSNRHRSKYTSCTRFRKDLDFWFWYGVPLYSLYGLDISKNLLLPLKKLITTLQLLLSHTYLTSFWEMFW